MSEIVLCVGKVCSGKSTFAAHLKQHHDFYHFSSDEWMLHFYEPTPDRELFDVRLAKCEEMIYCVSEDILARAGNVVLDAGFWKRAERLELQGRFSKLGHTVTFVYFPISLDRQLAYGEKRNRDRLSGTYAFDRATVEILNGFFEEPDCDEPMTNSEKWLKVRFRR